MPFESLLASFSAQFTWIDWSIVVGYLALTTFIGTRMAGKQATIRDFFLGGRKLPWYAVSGSIIATEISAVTFVIVPMIVFVPGGNMTYLQLGLFGAIISRIIVAYWLVPQYYKKEIYSPYDYMGNQLGGGVRRMTTVLFALGGMLAQSARVYLTAEILVVVLGGPLRQLSDAFGMEPLAWAIILIAIVAVTWTLIGGISTVIWTDALLFLVFLIGAFVALVAVIVDLPGGFRQMLSVGWNVAESGPWGKFTFFDFGLSNDDPYRLVFAETAGETWRAASTRTYTIWAAVIANTWGSIGAYGTDQLIAQRIFCCKNERAARWAMISSALSQIVTFTMALVGVGLYAYYIQQPVDGAAADAHPLFPRLAGEARELYEENSNRIFPIFIVKAIPQGLSGLILAGIFAAAVSSMTSILAALSQTTMSAFTRPESESEPVRNPRRTVFVGRLLVLGWGIVLAGMAFIAAEIAREYPSILDLALAMAGYTAGALLAGFFLAFFPLKIDGRGYMFAGPLSVLSVFALIVHDPWRFQRDDGTFFEFAPQIICWIGAAGLLIAWLVMLAKERDPRARRDAVWQTQTLLLGLSMMLALSHFGYFTDVSPDGTIKKTSVAWPWQTPFGSVVALAWGYWLARAKRTPET